MAKYKLPTTILLAVAVTVPGLAQAPARPGLQPISKAVFTQRLDQEFAVADVNKDGFADRSELVAQQAKSFADRKAAMLREREAAFRQLDTDNSGSLTLQEFNARASASQSPQADVTPTLNRFDTNKDGKISRAENRALAIGQFDRSDTNKDGTLSIDEQQRARGKR